MLHIKKAQRGYDPLWDMVSATLATDFCTRGKPSVTTILCVDLCFSKSKEAFLNHPHGSSKKTLVQKKDGKCNEIIIIMGQLIFL